MSACAGAPTSPLDTPAETATLATFTVREHIDHRFQDELLHFDFDVPEPRGEVWLSGPGGAPVLAQLEGLTHAGGRLRGRVWTVASLEPHGRIDLALRAGHGRPPEVSPGAWIAHEAGTLVLGNDRLAVAIPELDALAAPTDLRALPPPVRSVRAAGGAWLGGAAWVKDGAPLLVEKVATEIVEAGPVRVTVRQRLSFVGGQSYVAVISLAARQDAALVTEDADVRAPGAALRIAMGPGIDADHAFWQTQWTAPEGHHPYELIDTRPTFDREQVVSHLRPWSFWWLSDISQWAGFYRGAAEPFAGVLLLRPSRWRPGDWGGFDRTEIPVTARKGGGLDLTLVLDAHRSGDDDGALHREWALAAGTVAEHVTRDAAHTRMRALLIKHSEFPLDELKELAFDFTPAPREHPSLLFTRADLERVRRQAKTDPTTKAVVDRAVAYIINCGYIDQSLAAGPAAAYDRYVNNYLVEALPAAYLGSDDPRWGRFLAAVIEGFTHRIVKLFVEDPERPSLGAYGPWRTADVTNLALALDLMTGTPYLSPEKEAEARSALVLGAHILQHPDFWNAARGLASANPNMHAAIRLPLGLLAVVLAGYPDAARWRREAEAYLEGILDQWISPGGAFVENPYYQLASMDSIMMLAAALRGAGYHDYFTDPRLRSTLEYLGFVLTAPDRRFTFTLPAGPPAPVAPMILPPIGDSTAGVRSLYNGWMAATSGDDPAYRARQQFYWRAQASSMAGAGRAAGYGLALTDAEAPAAAPEETSAGFPGFGSVMRSSWTDPLQSYVAHRTGPTSAHYHEDQGSFVYYAKGAPLCLDWSYYTSGGRRADPGSHNEVTVAVGTTADMYAPHGELIGVRSLPGFFSVSHGTSSADGGEDDRHLFLVMSADPRGANYLVLRDHTVERRAQTHRFFENLWVLSGEPTIHGQEVHLPGQLGVDLEVSILSPHAPRVAKDHWAWAGEVGGLGQFSEDQWGLHVTRAGSAEDFLTVLYPRASGERAPRVSALAGSAGARVAHSEGVDVLVLSPDQPAWVRDGGAELHGEMALARRYDRGGLRLVVMARGAGAWTTSAALGEWGLESDGQVALEITGGLVTGLSRGEPHSAVITLPPRFGAATTLVDGTPIAAVREGRTLTLALPAGAHALSIRRVQ